MAQFTAVDPVVRFWAKVDRRGSDECWLWLASHVRGYGRFSDGGAIYAHRWSYLHHVGPIPEGMLVCHSCDNPPCVNPAHLWLGTNDDNMADKKAKGRNCYGDRNGSRTHPERRHRGETSPLAKLSDGQAREIYDRLKSERQHDLAIEFNVSKQLISRIAKGKGRYVWLLQAS